MFTKLKNFLILVICFPALCYSQQYLFMDNGAYKYLIGTQEPDSNWRKPDFDDSDWLHGYKNIGYGHQNDSTKIPPTISLYMRIKFNETDSAIKTFTNFNLRVDFDDAFVAYLNGKEIARVNLGKPGSPVPYNRLSDRAHDAYGYRDYYNPIDGYYIDDSVVSKCIIAGINVLAIQVQNDSVNGSDLSFNCHLINLTNSYYSLWNSSFRYFRQVQLDSSKFPIIEINTDAFGIPEPHIKYVAKMGIVNNGTGK